MEFWGLEYEVIEIASTLTHLFAAQPALSPTTYLTNPIGLLFLHELYTEFIQSFFRFTDYRSKRVINLLKRFFAGNLIRFGCTAALIAISVHNQCIFLSELTEAS